MYILQPYDDLLNKILRYGKETQNRTGVPTLFLHSEQLRINVSTFAPIITRRKIPIKSIIDETLWFISGSTNIDDMKICRYWDYWRSVDFEQKFGYNKGELGPIYGWSLRSYNLDYTLRHLQKRKDNQGNITFAGFDQLQWAINELQTNPTSRAIVIDLWNPLEKNYVRLPWCHRAITLNTYSNELFAQIDMRSSDVPIGLPTNLLMYYILISCVAQLTHLRFVELVFVLSNAHVYIDQIESCNNYLSSKRDVYSFSPTMELVPAQSIDHYTMNNIIIHNYFPGPKLHIPVAV